MVKLIGATLVTFSCTAVGLALAKRLEKRISMLDTLYCLLNEFSISIQYTAPTVWQLMDCAYYNPEFKDVRFLKNFHNELPSEVAFEILWKRSIENDITLQLPERDVLFSLGNSLGKVGCEESVSNLHLAMNRLKLIHEQSMEDYVRKGNLFRWLGVLLGIGISIVMV
jgi:stage III sporulation protein AB